MGEYCVAFFDVTGPWASVFSDEFPDYIENINKHMLPDNSAIIKNEGRGFIQNCISLLMGCVENTPAANVWLSTAGWPWLYFSMHFINYICH